MVNSLNSKQYINYTAPSSGQFSQLIPNYMLQQLQNSMILYSVNSLCSYHIIVYILQCHQNAYCSMTEVKAPQPFRNYSTRQTESGDTLHAVTKLDIYTFHITTNLN